MGRAYAEEVRERAVTLRTRGMARADIARELGVGFSTVCRWLRDSGLVAPEGRSRLEAWRASHRRTIDERWALQEQEQLAHRNAVGALTDRELFLVGVALYWAEGAKSKPWRRQERIVFVNSDPSMVQVFLKWLEGVGVDRSQLRCHVMIHESADIQGAESTWRSVVGPDVTWGRTSLKRHRDKVGRQNRGSGYIGCLAIKVANGAGLYRRVAGTWQGIAAAAIASDRPSDPSPVV